MLNDAMAIRHQQLMFDIFMTVMKRLDWRATNARNNTDLNLFVKHPHHPKKVMLYNQIFS